MRSAAIGEVWAVSAPRAAHPWHEVQLARAARARQVLGSVVPRHGPAAPEAAHQHGAQRRAVYRVEGQGSVVRRLHVWRQVVLRRRGRGRPLRLCCRLLAFLFHLQGETWVNTSHLALTGTSCGVQIRPRSRRELTGRS